MIHFDFEEHEGWILLIPMLACAPGKCDQCNEIHGLNFQAGWLIWTFHITFTWS